jgi:hypothetical protein
MSQEEVNSPEIGEQVEVSAFARKVTPEKQREYYDNRRTKKKASDYKYDSTVEPTKPEALRVLELRGIKNKHVLDVVYKNLLRAAEENDVPANRFLFQNGVVKTLVSYVQKAPQTLDEISTEPVAGELLNRAELYALYDSSLATHEPTSFDEFLATRLRCKKDCWYLGKEILEKDFADCHRAWTEFFPKFEPTTLPPQYTQKQAIKWMNEQSPEIKDFLLLASRSAFKSSWSHVWILSLILCQPDIRILLVSETKPLSKDFIGVIRSYFETTSGQETRFHRFFAEFTIPAGDGSVLSLDCPMAHLKLAQSIESTSMDSAVAGRRADVILFDDPISSTSCGNDVQIQASINKYLALIKLREVGGLVLLLGTPWAETDLFSRLIQMSDEGDRALAYRIDPAFVVKKTARHKLTPALLPTLVESDVESFLFPERLDWKFLRREISASPSFFMSQNLCIFPRSEDADLRVTFELEDLEKHTRAIGHYETAAYTKCISLDRAWSTSRYADYSCVTVGRIQQYQNKQVAVIIDAKMDRLKESELVKAICDMIVKHRDIKYFVAEKDKGFEQLWQSIQRQLNLRGIPAPHFTWAPILAGAQNAGAKAKRAKRLELPLLEDRLWFATGEWNEVCFKQLCDFDGLTKSNSHRKDDFVDSLGLFWVTYGPKYEPKEDVTTDPEEQKRIEKEAEEEQRRELSRAHHARMFGDAGGNQFQEIKHQPEPQRTPQEDPRTANLMKILPESMRRRGQR